MYILRLNTQSSSSVRGFNSFSRACKRYRENRVVAFTPQQLYDVVSDVANYKKFVPFCVDSRILRRNGASLDAELAVGFKAFTERYTSRVTCQPPNLVSARAVDSAVFSELSSIWRFAPGPTPETTSLTFDVAFRVKNPIASVVVNAFFEEVTQQQVRAFERRCRALYGKNGKVPTAATTVETKTTSVTPDATELETAGLPPAAVHSVKQFQVPISILRAMWDACITGHEADKEHAGLSTLGPPQFLNACKKLASNHKSKEAGEGVKKGTDAATGFRLLAADAALAQTVLCSLSHMVRARRKHLAFRARKIAAAEGRLKEVTDTQDADPETDVADLGDFVVSLYMMVEAPSEERARYMFLMMDTDGDSCLSRVELQRALALHIECVSRVIPLVIRHLLTSAGGAGTDEEDADCDECTIDGPALNHVHANGINKIGASKIGGSLMTDNGVVLKVDSVLAETEAVVKRLLEDIRVEIPSAVEEVFSQLSLDNKGSLKESEWTSAWHQHPELLDMMSVTGMSKIVLFASQLVDNIPANGKNADTG